MQETETRPRVGGCETTGILALLGDSLTRYLQGYGVDFGCEFDPVPGAAVLVDGQKAVYEAFKDTHEVHIRDINAGFDDWTTDGRQFDFAYSSHLLEHVVDPHAFLRTCYALLKPGGYLVLVLPDGDFYWPNGHPNANPDHKWWTLTQGKVQRWAGPAGFTRCVFYHAATACQGTLWSFVLVFQKPASEVQASEAASAATSEATSEAAGA